MSAKLKMKPTPKIDFVLYTDGSESGWRAHNVVTSIAERWSNNERRW